jgi:DNA-binding SARP family transcriptional activator
VDARCRIHLLGGLRVCQGEREITRFRTQKTAALLAYLAYFLGRRHPRDVLIELFWPEGNLDAGRHNLSVAVSWLRQQLEPPGVADGAVLIADRFSVRLDPAAVTTDAGEFEAALRSAGEAAAAGEQIACLERAAELYHGELLPGFYDDWIPPEQHRLRASLLQALQQLIQKLERSGQADRALVYARRAVGADPLNEEAHRTVMRLHAATGEPSAALRDYRDLAALLKRELATAPSAATRALAREIAEAVSGADEAAEAHVPDVKRPSAEEPSSAAPPSPPPPDGDPAAGRARPIPREPLEPVGGAVPLGSRFYVPRETDQEFREAVERGDSIVLVKGARQVGKTSLLARELQHAREAGARVVFTDFQLLSEAHLVSADALLPALGGWIAEQLDLETLPSQTWDSGAPGLNFRRYMRREVLGRVETRLVWGLDEVDRLFSCGFASEVFGLFRSWHNERALDPAGPWSRLTLAMAYATEAHLFISDLNQSPFNVGTRLVLEDFTFDQVADLNGRYGCPLRDTESVRSYYRLVGGHPYLVRRGLHEMATRQPADPRQRPIEALEAQADREEGLFGDHLRRMLAALAQDPGLREALRAVMRGQPCPSAESFFRLRSAGVLSGEAADEARFRCEVYARFLRRHLGGGAP